MYFQQQPILLHNWWQYKGVGFTTVNKSNDKTRLFQPKKRVMANLEG